METIKKGSLSLDVLSLQCSLPGLKIDGDFGDKTVEAVKKFQSDMGLDSDGIVGPGTWNLLFKTRIKRPSITEADYKSISESLGVSSAILKAIHEVETCQSSYLSSGHPALLFEAHVFYRELKKVGKNPDILLKDHPGIISKSWNRSLYKGGIREVTRINEAFRISPKAALMSASFGAFQICGFNYSLSGYQNVFEFYRDLWISEVSQLQMLANFLKGSGIVPYMKSLNFREIAKRYNGSEYEKNNYHTKLEKAYNKFK